MSDNHRCVHNAFRAGTVVPAFNISYLPMAEPVARGLRDCDVFGFLQVARLEWEKFEVGGLRPMRDEYEKVKDERYTGLHLDHLPVIDEDGRRVDYRRLIAEALELGYESVMVDGSRLPLDENIAATAKVVRMAHGAGVPAEAELGAVLGHEEGPLPPYEELFSSGRGFTDPAEAGRFARETRVDWLSVAVGNVHGAVARARRDEKKVEARLNLEHLDRIREAAGVPLVLHGGSGIPKARLLPAFERGIAKINIATSIRQAYERGHEQSLERAQEAVYGAVVDILTRQLEIAGTASIVREGCAF